MSKIPKYRNLTLDELKPLEKEFVDFLVLNGILAEEWEKLKVDNHDKAEDILTLFSDTIFEGILRNTKFIEFRDSSSIKAFHCLDKKMILVGVEGNTTFDFTKSDEIKSAIQNPPVGLKIFYAEKSYRKAREQELFDLLQSGAYISDGVLFKALSIAYHK